jgi:hypothetical protein
MRFLNDISEPESRVFHSIHLFKLGRTSDLTPFSPKKQYNDRTEVIDNEMRRHVRMTTFFQTPCARTDPSHKLSTLAHHKGARLISHPQLYVIDHDGCQLRYRNASHNVVGQVQDC